MREYWAIHVIIRGAKEQLGSWTEPRVNSYGEVEADWINDPDIDCYTPGFIDWDQVSAVTWRHMVSGTGTVKQFKQGGR